jgi:7,8-dihydropterin-6-yl-methyl-4-(beta-D-ribofuranosyl)aminobenzene 5'-phosphate synthase
MSIHGDSLSLTVIYDNNSYDQNLKKDWGFSCRVKGTNKTILFDTGADGEILLSNMKQLKIDPAEIDLIFLSHEHGDHTGGLFRFLDTNPKVELWFPKSFSTIFKNNITPYQVKSNEVVEFKPILANVYSTGEMGTTIKEQSLIIKTDKGLIVITGCAHPGIIDIIAKAKEQLKEEIYLVIGGFHLLDYPDEDLEKIIKRFRKLGVKKVGPCHCSGDRCRELFKEEYKENFIDIGVGTVIRIK